jgi:predicted transcriptional regulator
MSKRFPTYQLTSIRFDLPLSDALDEMARRLGHTRSSAVRQAVREWLAAQA